MEEKNIKQMWQDYNNQIKQQSDINTTLLKESKMTMARSELNQLAFRRWVEAFLFLVCFLLLVRFIGDNFPNPACMAAGFVLMAFSIIGIVGSLLQIGLIRSLDYSLSVMQFQEKMQKLKLYSLRTLRLIFMSLPFYFAYLIIGFKALLGIDIVAQASPNWLLGNLGLSILFVPVAVWLYRNLNYTSGRNWVRTIIEENGGHQIRSALRSMDEIGEFKSE